MSAQAGFPPLTDPRAGPARLYSGGPGRGTGNYCRGRDIIRHEADTRTFNCHCVPPGRGWARPEWLGRPRPRPPPPLCPCGGSRDPTAARPVRPSQPSSHFPGSLGAGWCRDGAIAPINMFHVPCVTCCTRTLQLHIQSNNTMNHAKLNNIFI